MLREWVPEYLITCILRNPIPIQDCEDSISLAPITEWRIHFETHLQLGSKPYMPWQRKWKLPCMPNAPIFYDTLFQQIGVLYAEEEAVMYICIMIAENLKSLEDSMGYT